MYRKAEGAQLAADSYYGSFDSQRRFVLSRARKRANKLSVSPDVIFTADFASFRRGGGGGGLNSLLPALNAETENSFCIVITPRLIGRPTNRLGDHDAIRGNAIITYPTGRLSLDFLTSGSCVGSRRADSLYQPVGGL